MDIITGLDLGGDDYITKPFKLGVLLSRVHALQPAQQIEQSALAGTALAHHGHKFALGHRKAHVLQRLHGSLAGAVSLAKGLCLQQIHTKTFFRFDLSTAYHPFATAR